MTVKFYYCAHCKNILGVAQDGGVVPVCCGEQMIELTANTTDAATEKHVPVVKIKDNILTATVGEVAHPMVPEHYIQWICLVTDQGVQRKVLKPETEPVASFALLDGEKPLAVYEYCNLHGLWKIDL